MSSTYFEHLSFHPQEDLYVQFYVVSFMHPYKQTGRWQDEYQAHPAIDQTAYTDAWKKYCKPARTSLTEDENLDVRNMSKTL